MTKGTCLTLGEECPVGLEALHACGWQCCRASVVLKQVTQSLPEELPPMHPPVDILLLLASSAKRTPPALAQLWGKGNKMAGIETPNDKWCNGLILQLPYCVRHPRNIRLRYTGLSFEKKSSPKIGVARQSPAVNARSPHHCLNYACQSGHAYKFAKKESGTCRLASLSCGR